MQSSVAFNDLRPGRYTFRLRAVGQNGNWSEEATYPFTINPPWWQTRLAIGSYQQPPFYRELRDREGQINPQVQAQSSTHFILGTEYNFSLWGRPFVFFSEAYYKHLYNLNLYDIENVRLRYFANNDADGYAAGVDFRSIRI